MAPKKKGGYRRRGGPGHEGRVNLLSLVAGYLGNPEAFAREGPPEQPPLPLKFTCSTCGSTVAANASRCGQCGAKLYQPGGPGDATRK